MLETKRFIGNDLGRLYRRVRDEFGPDALVLGTRSLHREGAPPLIELSAAPPAEDGGLPLDVQQAMLNTVLSRVAPGITVGDLEELVLQGAIGPGQAPRPEPSLAEPAFEFAPPAGSSLPVPEPDPPTLADELIAAGLSDRAAALVEEAFPASPPEQALASYLGGLQVPYPDESETALITMDGPHGAGRTTALLRLALDCAEAGRPALLVAADTSHAATATRIAAYGDAMDIPAVEAFEEIDLLRALRKASRGTCLFVDTPPGWEPPPGAGSRARHFPFLALPAHWQVDSLRAALRQLSAGSWSGAVPTFTDIVTALAPSISLSVETGLGVAFLSSGSDISTGITVADPRSLASGIFTRGTGERTNGRLVASA